MPELNIRSRIEFGNEYFPELRSEPNAETLRWLFGLMCWPKKEEEERRNAFVALGHFELRERIDSSPFLKEEPLLERALDIHLQMLGGWKGISNLPPKKELFLEARKRMARGAWVGATLCTAYLIHKNYGGEGEEEISLQRIRKFLFRARNEFFENPPEKEALKDAWNEFKSVAHLWAGQYFVKHYMARQVAEVVVSGLPPSVTQADVERECERRLVPLTTQAIFAMAKEFQEFGLTYTPARSARPLLDADLLWTLVDVPECPIECPRIFFSDDLLEIFDDDKD